MAMIVAECAVNKSIYAAPRKRLQFDQSPRSTIIVRTVIFYWDKEFFMCTPLICVSCNSVMLNLFDAAICPPLVFNLT